VARGNREVINSVASNPGARFSSASFLDLVKRSEKDTILADSLGVRRDIPRHLFQQLIARASVQVRDKMLAEVPHLAADIRTSVVAETGNMHSKFGPASKEYFAAKRAVTEKHRQGNLKEKEILRYATSHQFEETVVSLSLATGLAAHIVERAVSERSGETLMILSKALNFEWATAMALLFLGAEGNKTSRQQLDELNQRYADLSVQSARDVVHSLHAQKASSAAPVNTLAHKHAV